MFFELKGDEIDGYNEEMFSERKKPLQGFKLFKDNQLKIIKS